MKSVDAKITDGILQISRNGEFVNSRCPFSPEPCNTNCEFFVFEHGNITLKCIPYIEKIIIGENYNWRK